MPNEKITLYFENLRGRLGEVPGIVGKTALNYFLDEFKAQQWDGVPWEARKDKKNDRPLLVKSRNLYRSIRVIDSSFTSVIIGTDVPYARIHNDGGIINRPAREEKFIRPRYTNGKKVKMFGGLGAFRKMTKEEKAAAPTKGQRYRAYTITIPRRRFLGVTPALKAKIREAVIKQITGAY